MVGYIWLLGHSLVTSVWKYSVMYCFFFFVYLWLHALCNILHGAFSLNIFRWPFHISSQLLPFYWSHGAQACAKMCWGALRFLLIIAFYKCCSSPCMFVHLCDSVFRVNSQRSNQNQQFSINISKVSQQRLGHFHCRLCTDHTEALSGSKSLQETLTNRDPRGGWGIIQWTQSLEDSEGFKWPLRGAQ